jgi:hypothetical protein
MSDVATGKCGCGKVAYTISGSMEGLVSCHCKLCQRLHGNYNPMVIVDTEQLVFTADTSLAWFDSSIEARRGFCKEYDSALFKEQKNGPKILVAVGSLDDTSGLTNIKSVFTEDAGHYYLMPPEL